MKLTERLAGRGGALRPGFLDLLTAAILLAILLYAAWKQFPAFNSHVISAPAASQPTPSPPASRNR